MNNEVKTKLSLSNWYFERPIINELVQVVVVAPPGAGSYIGSVPSSKIRVRRFFALISLLVATAIMLTQQCSAEVIKVGDFGAKGDGISNDGPSIQKAVAALSKSSYPRILKFEHGRRYRVTSAINTWLIRLDGLADVTIDGAGAEFILSPKVRFLHLTNCKQTTICDLSVDFNPLPFVEGVVVAFDPSHNSIDARISPEYPMPPLGGPTGDREQAYFGMVYPDSTLKPDAPVSAHIFIRDTREAHADNSTDRIVRVIGSQPFGAFPYLVPGKSRIALPVRGVAHVMEGHGASPVFVIEDNDMVDFRDIGLWSGPLFGVNVARNRGVCTFKHFDIMPKPGTKRFTSTWRDGFHVKGNRGALVWENCTLVGMNDDAFNIATHSSNVDDVTVDGKLHIHQNFPLGFIPFEVGDYISGYSATEGRCLGRESRVKSVTTETAVDLANPDHPAPPLLITLDKPLSGVRPGDTIWSASSANPGATLKGCHIENSCRFQSGVTIKSCDFSALAWFYGDSIEGPLPHGTTITRSHFKRGRGNPQIAVSFTSLFSDREARVSIPTQPVIFGLRIDDCSFEGQVEFNYVKNITLQGNNFKTPGYSLAFKKCAEISLRSNILDNAPLIGAKQLRTDNETLQNSLIFVNKKSTGQEADGHSK